MPDLDLIKQGEQDVRDRRGGSPGQGLWLRGRDVRASLAGAEGGRPPIG